MRNIIHSLQVLQEKTFSYIKTTLKPEEFDKREN